MKKNRHAIQQNPASCEPVTRLHPLTRAVRLSLHCLVAGGIAAVVNVPIALAEPPRTEIPVAAAQFVASGAAHIVPGTDASALTVQQDSIKTILNWNSFNIGRDASVRFDQRQGASSLAVNRIFQNSPSEIFGKLSSNGQVYLVNQNGILFGAGSQVQVGGLVATSLDPTQEALDNGIGRAIDSGKPAFVAATDGNGNILSKSVVIDTGARLNADKNGQILILAPEVINRGTITTNEGQALLAAGTKVYLMQSDSISAGSIDNLRGFLVEVDTDGVTDEQFHAFMQDKTGNVTLPVGTVTNLGQVNARSGNITLAGLAVNQNGRLSATTSTALNGSIRLIARDRVSISTNGSDGSNPESETLQIDVPLYTRSANVAKAGRTGQVSFGTDSVSQVVPDTADTATDVDINTQPLSFVEADGARILLQGNSAITATGGQVYVSARSADSDVGARIFLDTGSRIDVSGSDVDLPMSRNVLEVELRGDQLKDSPLQRDGFLRNKKITVDLRRHGVRADGTAWVGTPLADLSGDVANIRRSVAERTVAGGNVMLRTDGAASDVVMRDGANIDISGGAIHYQGGMVNTTTLVGADGKNYDIADASAERTYTGFGQTFTKNYDKWGVTKTWAVVSPVGSGAFEVGYAEGKDAGVVTFNTPRAVIEGNIRGDVTIGRLQRQKAQTIGMNQIRPSDQIPLAGKLVVGDSTAPAINKDRPDYRVSDIELSASKILSDEFDAHDAIPGDTTMHISPDLFGASGLGRAELYANGRIDIPANVDLNMRAGSDVKLTAAEINIDGKIHAPSGSVSITAADTHDRLASDGDVIAATFGEGSLFDLRGVWVNDSIAGASPVPVLIDGGSLSANVKSGNFVMMSGSTVDVSGGAWLQRSGVLRAGRGGNMSLTASSLTNSTSSTGVTPALFDIGGTLMGASLGTGGNLSLNANQFCIGDATCPNAAGVVGLNSDFFHQGGFSSYSLTSNLNGISVQDGTVVTPRAQQLVLNGKFRGAESSANISNVASLQDVPDIQRVPVNLSLQVSVPGNFNFSQETFGDAGYLRIGKGARITTDPGASVKLGANTWIDVEGEISAPAGSIALELNPGLQNLTEFIPQQAIWLGSQSVLDTSGVTRLQPNLQQLRQGDVLGGGTVAINARRGYIVTERGSRIDVSGTSATLDLPIDMKGHTAPTVVASDAGVVQLSAAEGMLLDGEFAGHGGGAHSAGGSLELTLDAGNRDKPQLPVTFPETAREIIVRNGGSNAVPTGLDAGDAIPDALSGQALLDANAVQQGGFDALALHSRNILGAASDGQSATLLNVGGIQFRGDVIDHEFSLALARRLVLDAARIGATSDTQSVSLSAPYVALGNSGATDLQQATSLTPGNPVSLGTATLNVDAQFIDVIGHSNLENVGAVALRSTGDIRLRGTQNENSDRLTGALTTAASLTLQADQIYPSTLSEFSVLLRNNPDGVLHVVAGDGKSPVLSAGGILHLDAPTIVQDGTLKAPLGEIELTADHLILGNGSVTSVSAEGQLIPFGKTQAGEDWVYSIDDQQTRVFSSGSDPLPQKRVNLVSSDIDEQSGAVIDLSGGGDLFSYEFIPGVGGSHDVLSNANTSKSFAIVPTLNGQFAPYDPQSYRGSSLQPGDSVYLSGVDGLAAGTYALLPARYALLPGAFLVTQVQGYRDLLAGQRTTLLNGAQVTSGYRVVGGTTIHDSRTSGFAVRSGESLKRDAHYDIHTGNDFFSAQAAEQGTSGPRLARDAGVLSIVAGHSLKLDGLLQANADKDGRGAAVDITADKIAIVLDTAGNNLPSDTVALNATALNALGAESLLIGGQRSDGFDGTHIDVTASTIDVLNDNQSVLRAPELILAAKDKITVGADSALSGTGVVSGATSNYIVGSDTVSGDGALLRLAAGPQAQLQRVNSMAVTGVLDVQVGATLTADQSIILDATRDNLFAGSFVFNNPGELALSSSRISLGQAPSGTTGLVLAPSQLAGMENLKQLDLRSYTSLDLYGSLDLQFNNLGLQAARINGHHAAGETATLAAQDTLTLSNPNAASIASTADGAGALMLSGSKVVLGAGTYNIQGFDNTTLRATTEIVGQGKTQLNVASALRLDTPRLTGAAKSDLTLQAADVNGDTVSNYFTLDLVSTANPNGELPETALGARVRLVGEKITSGIAIDAASGVVELVAKGTGTDDGIVLGDGSVITVAASERTFGDKKIFAPAGSVSLTSDHGSIDMQAGSTIDLASSEGGGDAGRLSVHASEGQADFGGNVFAQAPVSYQGGVFDLDAHSLGDYSALNTILTDAGFTQSQTVRVRTGNVSLGADDVITTHSYSLTTDTGGINISGTIDASGTKSGQIKLAARDDVSVNNGAQLDASAHGQGKKGGRVQLESGQGGVLLEQGSTVNVSGASTSDGTLAIRLPRTSVATLNDSDTTNDRLRMAGTVTGAGRTTVEAVAVYQDEGTLSSADVSASASNARYQDAATFMQQNSTAVTNALGTTGDPGFHLVAGVEIQSTGDMTLAADWDLSQWRFNGEAGVLTLRAGRNLNIGSATATGRNATNAGALSDGFTGSWSAGGTAPITQLAGDSWSYRLVAGADRTSADTLAVQRAQDLPAGSGTFKLANGTVGAGTGAPNTRVVRTGNGSIDIAAANNIVLGNRDSVIYTAGVPSATGVALPALGGNARKYPQNGGDISLHAQGNVVGARTNQFVNEWLWRAGRSVGPAASATGWTVAFDRFESGVGALAGGNVNVSAGGDVSNLSVAIPTIGRQVGGTTPQQNRVEIIGGGDMSVVAGRDIESGSYYLGRGDAVLHAGDAIVSERTASPSAGATTLNPVLALGDGHFDLGARGDVTIESVINPTVAPMGRSQNVGLSKSFFFTYGDNSGVNLTSIAGDVTLNNDIDALGRALFQSTQLEPMLKIYAPSLHAYAYSGDIAVNNGFTLFPAPKGNLELLAQNDVTFSRTVNVLSGAVLLSDADVHALPGVNNPSGVTTDIQLRLQAGGDPVKTHAPTPVHADANQPDGIADNEPVRIVASLGDIVVHADDSGSPIELGKPALISAGRDIIDLNLTAQNLHDGDVTSIFAGRDLRYTTQRSQTGLLQQNLGQISIDGPGALLVRAGRNINLGTSEGIVARGDTLNPALPSGGADITVIAGSSQAPSYNEFHEAYLTLSSDYRTFIVAAMRKLAGDDTLTPDAALGLFDDLSDSAQQALILKGFFNEIQIAGRDAVHTGSKDYSRGLAAIDALFPGASANHTGDLNLVFSRIYTLSGGDINFLTPGGNVNAGLATPPTDLGVNKEASKLGIVAQTTGDIHGLAHGDILVNESRIFAADGGDILLWSSVGDIDAGRGAKTSISAPPPRIHFDANGALKIEFPPALTGSGIRAFVTTTGREPGDVDLFAPLGVVNAGDAGIGSAGNVTIGAEEVRGAENIDVGGQSFGVPSDSGAIGAGALSGSNTASGATKGDGLGDSAKSEDKLSMLDVQVVGYGDADCEDGDTKACAEKIKLRKHQPDPKP